MQNWWIEAIGIVGTVVILAGFSFKTLSYRGSLWMRGVNILGEALMLVYGALICAVSTMVLESCLIVINVYHIFLLVRQHNKEKSEKVEENHFSN